MPRRIMDVENDTVGELFEKANDNFEEVYAADSKQDSEIKSKASQTDFNTLKARVDNITKTPAESTEGNAELLDIRVGADGKTYPTAGEAVRSLDNISDRNIRLIAGLKVSEYFESVSNVFYSISHIVKDHVYSIRVELEGSSHQFSVAFRKHDTGETNYQQVTISGDNQVLEKTLTALDDYDGLYFYSSNKVNANISIQDTTSMSKSSILLDEALSASANNYLARIRASIEIDDLVIIDFSDYEGEIPSRIGIAYRKSGESNINHQLITNTTGTGRYYLLSSDNYDEIAIYAHTECHSHITIYKCDSPSIEARLIQKLELELSKSESKVSNLANDLDTLKSDLATDYRTFSILGDSYSTFKGYTNPESNVQWYPPAEGNQGNNSGNDVSEVESTWWYQFADEYKCVLLSNNSYSGSPICYDGYGEGNEDAKLISFVGRASNLAKSELIIIFGGTNDDWAHAKLGDFKYSNWSEDDLSYFRPACAYLLNYLKQHNPGSRLVFILNNGLTSDINNSINDICQHYDVDLLKLTNVTKISNHPDKVGMTTIKNELINFLKNKK